MRVLTSCFAMRGISATYIMLILFRSGLGARSLRPQNGQELNRTGCCPDHVQNRGNLTEMESNVYILTSNFSEAENNTYLKSDP